MAARFPAEPFAPERLPDAAEPVAGVDPVFPAIYRAAVTGADAYRATRAALRRDGGILRLGNRFVPLDRYREIAFAALGSAAISQALAVSAALGESLTQGLVAGPDPLPREVPFRSRIVATGPPGRSKPEVGEEVLELARGLGSRDLLVLLLSSGSLGFLAQAPPAVGAEEWGRLIEALGVAGASSREVAVVARAVALGGVAGRVAASTRAETVALVVDRGDGADLVGGGPTNPLRSSERVEARATLSRAGLLPRLPAPVVAALAPQADRPDPTASPGAIGRTIALVTPAEALREAGDAAQAKRWKPMLADLSIDAAPEAAADRLVVRSEELLRVSSPLSAVGTGRAPRGLLTFAATTLAVPEGADERPAITRFLVRAAERLPWRGASVGLFRTAGARPGGAPPGGVAGARPSSGPSGAFSIRPLTMRPGITDVGLVAAVAIPVP